MYQNDHMGFLLNKITAFLTGFHEHHPVQTGKICTLKLCEVMIRQKIGNKATKDPVGQIRFYCCNKHEWKIKGISLPK
jgi:hypothetical protein